MKNEDEKYYKQEELEKGVDGLPPIKAVTLRNLRQKRRLKFSKLGRECVYRRDWIQEYLNQNIVEAKN
jgi:hypothetical protein